MNVLIRFLAIAGNLPSNYTPFTLPDGANAEALFHAVEEGGAAGAFGPAADWPGLPANVLAAADGRMLRSEDPLGEGQKISIIGQLIGG